MSRIGVASVLGAGSGAFAPIEVAERLRFSSQELYLAGGSPTFTNAGGLFPVWLLDASSGESVGCTFQVPSDWASVDVAIRWANAGAGSGDVVWRVAHHSVTTGENYSTGASTSSLVTATAGTQWVRVDTTILEGLIVTPGREQLIRVDRRASEAADTLANDAALVSVDVIKAS